MISDPFAQNNSMPKNPLFNGHAEKKESHVIAMTERMDSEDVVRLLTKDLALHAAITYYAAVTSNGQSHPPRGETIIKTAQTFEDYYNDMYGAR